MQNISKRTILWIVPIVILAVFAYFYGPKEEITDNEFITYIKEAQVDDSSKTYEEAFATSCEDEEWIFFKTQQGQHVVEFKGTCQNDVGPAKVNLQFVVEDNQSGYDVGVLLLNDVQQPQEQREIFLNAVASNNK